MFKKILTTAIYVALGLYALIMFATIISSGAVVAIIFVGIVGGYVGSMLASIKCSRRLEKYKEKLLADLSTELDCKGKILFLAMVANLPYYFP